MGDADHAEQSELGERMREERGCAFRREAAAPHLGHESIADLHVAGAWAVLETEPSGERTRLAHLSSPHAESRVVRVVAQHALQGCTHFGARERLAVIEIAHDARIAVETIQIREVERRELAQ